MRFQAYRLLLEKSLSRLSVLSRLQPYSLQHYLLGASSILSWESLDRELASAKGVERTGMRFQVAERIFYISLVFFIFMLSVLACVYTFQFLVFMDKQAS